MIHRLIATILTGLLLALGFSHDRLQSCCWSCLPPRPARRRLWACRCRVRRQVPSPSPEPEIRCGPSHALAPAHQRDCQILVDGAVVVEFSGERGRTGNFPLDGDRVWRGRIR
jgi:hypothetical protein